MVSRIWIVLAAFCLQSAVGDYGNCGTFSNELCAEGATVTFPPNSYFNWTIEPTASAILRFSFIVQNCTEEFDTCLVNSLLISEEDFKKIDEDINAQGSEPGDFFKTLNGSAAVQWPKTTGIGVYYLFIVNPSFVNTVTLEYYISYEPYESCIAQVLAASGVLGVVLVLCCCVVLCKKKKPEDTDTPVKEVIQYKYVEPATCASLNKCNCTLPFVKQQTAGFPVFCMQEDEILWVWFPTEGERLSKSQRFIVGTTFILFYFLIQTVWAQYLTREAEMARDTVAHVSDNNPAGDLIGVLILRIISANIVVTVAGIIYKPMMRIVMTKENCWAEEEQRWKVIVGKSITWLSAVVAAITFLFIFVNMMDLLNRFSCDDFLWAIFIPFIGSIIGGSIIPGVFIRLGKFFFCNTFGKKDPRDQGECPEESVTLLSE